MKASRKSQAPPVCNFSALPSHPALKPFLVLHEHDEGGCR